MSDFDSFSWNAAINAALREVEREHVCTYAFCSNAGHVVARKIRTAIESLKVKEEPSGLLGQDARVP